MQICECEPLCPLDHDAAWLQSLMRFASLRAEAAEENQVIPFLRGSVWAEWLLGWHVRDEHTEPFEAWTEDYWERSPSVQLGFSMMKIYDFVCSTLPLERMASVCVNFKDVNRMLLMH